MPNKFTVYIKNFHWPSERLDCELKPDLKTGTCKIRRYRITLPLRRRHLASGDYYTLTEKEDHLVDIPVQATQGEVCTLWWRDDQKLVRLQDCDLKKLGATDRKLMPFAHLLARISDLAPLTAEEMLADIKAASPSKKWDDLESTAIYLLCAQNYKLLRQRNIAPPGVTGRFPDGGIDRKLFVNSFIASLNTMAQSLRVTARANKNDPVSISDTVLHVLAKKRLATLPKAIPVGLTPTVVSSKKMTPEETKLYERYIDVLMNFYERGPAETEEAARAVVTHIIKKDAAAEGVKDVEMAEKYLSANLLKAFGKRGISLDELRKEVEGLAEKDPSRRAIYTKYLSDLLKRLKKQFGVQGFDDLENPETMFKLTGEILKRVVGKTYMVLGVLDRVNSIAGVLDVQKAGKGLFEVKIVLGKSPQNIQEAEAIRDEIKEYLSSTLGASYNVDTVLRNISLKIDLMGGNGHSKPSLEAAFRNVVRALTVESKQMAFTVELTGIMLQVRPVDHPDMLFTHFFNSTRNMEAFSPEGQAALIYLADYMAGLLKYNPNYKFTVNSYSHNYKRGKKLCRNRATKLIRGLMEYLGKKGVKVSKKNFKIEAHGYKPVVPDSDPDAAYKNDRTVIAAEETAPPVRTVSTEEQELANVLLKYIGGTELKRMQGESMALTSDESIKRYRGRLLKIWAIKLTEVPVRRNALTYINADDAAYYHKFVTDVLKLSSATSPSDTDREVERLLSVTKELAETEKAFYKAIRKRDFDRAKGLKATWIGQIQKIDRDYNTSTGTEIRPLTTALAELHRELLNTGGTNKASPEYLKNFKVVQKTLRGLGIKFMTKKLRYGNGDMSIPTDFEIFVAQGDSSNIKKIVNRLPQKLVKSIRIFRNYEWTPAAPKGSHIHEVNAGNVAADRYFLFILPQGGSHEMTRVFNALGV